MNRKLKIASVGLVAATKRWRGLVMAQGGENACGTDRT